MLGNMRGYIRTLKNVLIKVAERQMNSTLTSRKKAAGERRFPRQIRQGFSAGSCLAPSRQGAMSSETWDGGCEVRERTYVHVYVRTHMRTCVRPSIVQCESINAPGAGHCSGASL